MLANFEVLISSSQDDPSLFDYNVKERITSFLGACLDQAEHYATNHIMLTMGSDFQYEDAREWHNNLDKLIHYVNSAVSGVASLQMQE